MKKLILALLGLCSATGFGAEPAAPTAEATLTTIRVDSPAFVFSPGNWTGDEGRGGKEFRQTWYSGAYFRVTWETKQAAPTAKLALDCSTYTDAFKPPKIAYAIDGVWKVGIPCASEIAVEGLAGAGRHELSVFLQWSEQKERWGSEGKSGLNVLRVTGLEVDAESAPVATSPRSKWALIIGDSITEGVGTTDLGVYSHLLGEALETQGYEYGISACGWSGWLNPGDNPPGDVPGYYLIRNSINGTGGDYDDAASRWNKIDGNGHSLLDATGRLSGYGQAGQEPALIFFNFGTNDALHKMDHSNAVASINQSLAALRRCAPEAEIIILIPFGQYYAKELKEAVESRQKGNPADTKIALIDLGVGAARNLAVKNGVMGGLHPNNLGAANFAAQIIPQVVKLLP
jgi:lysophospholipase L1-like esterase